MEETEIVSGTCKVLGKAVDSKVQFEGQYKGMVQCF
jgi:hypothetical protein